MTLLGINFVLRKVGNSITSYEEMKQNGDQWELNITSTFKNAHLKFKLGEEFDETTLDGRKCKVSRTLSMDCFSSLIFNIQFDK